MKTTKLFLLLFAGAALALSGCDKDKVEENVKPKYSISVTDDGNGTATGTVGGVAASTAEEGVTVMLTATPKEGYVFDKWTIESGGITLLPDATSTTAIFTMPAAEVSVKAIFAEIPSYSINLTDDGNGTAAAMVGNTVVSTAVEGATVLLTATPKEGCVFDKWIIESGDITLTPDATSNPVTFTMPAKAVSVKVMFAEIPSYSINLTDDGNGTAAAMVGNTAVSTAVEGAAVLLTATPKEGYTFDKWIVESGGITLVPDVTSNPVTFTMPATAVSVKAEFKEIEYSITMTDNGHGTASVTVGGVTASAAKRGTTVTLTATPKNGYAFDKWTIESGGITLLPDATLTPATFTMPAAAVNIKAEFVKIDVENHGIMINGIVWAKNNVDAPRTFTAKPEDYGLFYQWNRKKAWPVTGEVTDWDKTYPSGDSWEPANDPCPAGWRVPTKEEQATLLVTDKVSYQATTFNGVKGGKFTDKTSGNTLFFPNVGSRLHESGMVDAQNGAGFYWTSSPNTITSGWGIALSHGAAQYSNFRPYGLSVRCVLK